MTMQSLPLNTLCLSGLNVRQTERDADIAALADDIAARGLKQNLVVVPAHYSSAEATDGWGDKWEVIAGGRRYQAMQLLVADGRWPADTPVPCLLEDREDARETSLSENLHKVSMNPADEFAAYAAIIAGMDHLTRDDAIAACAKRFGKTVRHVEGRLRLASLCPEVLNALRANTITLDAAKAYALTTDHDLQRKVFAEREKDSWNKHDPKQIRNGIRGKTLGLDHPLATFVGLVTYQAEGGRIEGEMFMGAQGEQRLIDVPLLEKLARKIAEAAIPALVKVDGFKSGLLAKGTGPYANLPKPPAGFIVARDYGDTPSKAKLKKSIAIYAINDEGTGLQRIGRFKPEDESTARIPTRDWEAERAERDRSRAIDIAAARLALPSIKGTPFEGVTFYPKWHGLEKDDEENFVLVELLIRVPVTSVDAHRAEAERLVDEAAAAKVAEAAAKPTGDAADANDDSVDSEVAEA